MGKVKDSRKKNGTIVRRRVCPDCGSNFGTTEVADFVLPLLLQRIKANKVKMRKLIEEFKALVDEINECEEMERDVVQLED